MYLRKYQGYTHDRGRHKKAVIAVARQRVSIPEDFKSSETVVSL